MAKKKQSAIGAGPGDNHQKLDDPLDPRKVSLDIFENYCQEMLNSDDIGRRAYLIVKMRVSDSLYESLNFISPLSFIFTLRD